MTLTRKFTFRNATFVMTFDEDGVADTITRNGQLISAAHKDAKAILKQASALYSGLAPAGFAWVR